MFELESPRFSCEGQSSKSNLELRGKLTGTGIPYQELQRERPPTRDKRL
jgi:hypothetical protein